MAHALLLLLLVATSASAREIRYLEGEDYAGGRTPAWAPRSSGSLANGAWEGTSRGRTAILGEVPQPGVAAYHLGDGSLPPGEYRFWLRLNAGDNDRSVAVAFGPFGAGEAGPKPVGKAPDGGDDNAFHWQPVLAEGKPAVVTLQAGKDHALILSRAGNDSPYVDVIAFAPAASDSAPPAGPDGLNPRITPCIASAKPPAEAAPDAEMALFRMLPVPARPGEVSLSLAVTPDGAIYFPMVTAGRCRLSLNLRVAAGEGCVLDPGRDRVRLRFRELFSGAEHQVGLPLPGGVPVGEKRGLSMEVTPDQAPLKPGCHLVTADVVRDGRSLCGGRVGAAEVYVRRPEESRAHALMSFMVAHAGFNEDRLHGCHFVGMKTLIPSTYNPLDDATWHEWLKLYSGDTAKFLELIHDGGFGILHCAKVLRALGEIDRAAYAERIVAGDALYVLEKMVQENGTVHCCHDELEEKWPDLKAGHPTQTGDILQNDGFVLKLAAQCVFHLKDVPGQAKTVQRLMTRGAVLARHVCDPKWIPCQGCSVYDGRTISGQAWWALAVADQTGKVPQAEAETVLRNCRSAAMHALIHHGWYDHRCLVEGGCHVGYGVQNVINALQPGYAVAQLLGRADDMALMRKALRELYLFLAETNAVITGQPIWMPSRHSSWSNGHMYVLCSEYLRDFDDDPRIRAYRGQIGANFLGDVSGLSGGIGKWHGLNALATIAYSCPEYQAWEKVNGPLLY